MSSIDTVKLLLPISEEAPCGQDLEYDPAFMAIENELAGKSRQQMGDFVIEAEDPDWKKVIADSSELLERTHDLRVLVFLIRSAIAKDGFSAFSDGLTVLSRWVETQWENVYPLLDRDDDNDPTERVNVITTLCDLEVFLNPFLAIPIIESEALGNFSLKQIRDVQTGIGDTSLATIEAAVADSDQEKLQQKSEYLETSIEMLVAIENSLIQKVGLDGAPSLDTLLIMLKEALLIISGYISGKGGDIKHDGQTSQETSDQMPADNGLEANPLGTGCINSSQDVTEALEKIIEYYLKNEPSSPVPMLLKRAKGLVNMDFISIIKNIASDSESQVMNIRGPIEDEDSD